MHNKKVKYKVYVQMGRKGLSITLSIREQDKAELERLAQEFGMTWGSRLNISKLIEAIARRQLLIAPNHDWSNDRINILNQVSRVISVGNNLFNLPIKMPPGKSGISPYSTPNLLSMRSEST
jgi:hypothetical protein